MLTMFSQRSYDGAKRSVYMCSSRPALATRPKEMRAAQRMCGMQDPVARALSAWRMYSNAHRAPQTFSAFMLQGMLHAAVEQQGCLFADNSTMVCTHHWCHVDTLNNRYA